MGKFHQLKLVYEKMYQTSLEIALLIQNKRYDEVEACSIRRETLSSQLKRAKIPLSEQDIYPEEIQDLIKKLAEQESENLAKLEIIRTDLKHLMDTNSNQSKIYSAYAPSENQPRFVDMLE